VKLDFPGAVTVVWGGILWQRQWTSERGYICQILGNLGSGVLVLLGEVTHWKVEKLRIML
jgi:hypothetical protein